MQTRSFLLLLCLLIVCSTNAQTKQKPFSYFGSLQTGFLAGSSDIEFSAETRHGIQYKSWIAALSTGYDGYGIPGIPIMLYGQKDFTNLKHKPFAYVQSGVAIPIAINEWDEKLFNGSNRYDLKTGFIAEAGVGYQWKLPKKLQLVLSTGYSYKRQKADEHVAMFWNDFMRGTWPVNSQVNHWDYRYQRITFRVGLRF